VTDGWTDTARQHRLCYVQRRLAKILCLVVLTKSCQEMTLNTNRERVVRGQQKYENMSHSSLM